jgi:hypothetical protein
MSHTRETGSLHHAKRMINQKRFEFMKVCPKEGFNPKIVFEWGKKLIHPISFWLDS